MKKWEFSVAVIIKGKTREEAEKKLDIILNQDHYLYNDDELESIGDLILDGSNWDCEEYD